jgi:D-alanyl-D-alanine carboxypeptidase (penicillin-binding protein 5/6)
MIFIYTCVWAQEIDDMDFDINDFQIPVYNESIPPKISSPAAIAIDTENGRVLYEKNSTSKRQMASTVKMMTAILAIEKGNLDDWVEVSKRAAYVGGSQAYLNEGEKMKLGDMLYALMLPSGNDAAIAIAEHIGGNVENFVKMMDAKAREVGAYNTTYGSPHGLDRNNHSTAYDLAVIARYCLKDPIFSKIVSTKSIVLPREGNPQGKEYRNTNEMLRLYEGADGVKTGYTGPAGRCLVTSATRDGWQVVSVVLGANSRYARSIDSSRILDYVFLNYPLETILERNVDMVEVPVVKGVTDSIMAVNSEEIKMHISTEELGRIERTFIVPECITAPVKKGQKIGRVEFKIDNTLIANCELLAKEDIRFWTVGMNLVKIISFWQKYLVG